MREVNKKSIKTGTVFTKTEMNNEWNVNFLKNIPVSILRN